MVESIQEGPADTRGFRVGDVLGDTFRILFRNVIPFGAMALFCVGIIYGLGVLAGPYAIFFGETDAVPDINPWIIGLYMIFFVLGFFLLSAMVTYGTYQELRGRRAGFFDCVARGLALVLPIVGATFLVILITVLAYVALIIPGIIATVVLYVVIPVVIVERPGIVAALKRSSELTDGYRWSVFGIMFLIGIIDSITGTIADLIRPHMGSIAAMVLEMMAQSFSFLLMAITPAVAYYHLRRAKEGVDIEQIAAVFD